MITILIIVILFLFIEQRFKPRFDLTKDNWIVLWYNNYPHGKVRSYKLLIQI